LANVKFRIKETFIKESCTQEPIKFNTLSGLNNEMKRLTETMIDLGKVMLYENNLNNSATVEQLNIQYLRIEN
jgi:hypothetical protein